MVVDHYVTLNPVESGEYIMAHAKDVKVDTEKCKEVATMVMDAVLDGTIADIDYTANPLHPAGLTDEQALNWVFLLDTLNFSFWPEDGEEYNVKYENKTETGYLAMCAAFCKAHKAGIPITTTEWMVAVDYELLDYMLKGDSGHSIPMLMDRVHALRQAAEWLHFNHKGQFMNIVKASGGRAQTLLRFIMMIEPFRDVTEYKGRRVSFLKRAQILISDTVGVLKNSPTNAHLVAFPDLNTLTMFADYRVPQALCYLECLEYSEELLEQLQTSQRLQYGSERECEIRGASIFAVQKIYEEILRLRAAGPYKEVDFAEKRAVLPIDIDVWLWQFRREHAEDVEALVPFHRTRCIYY